ncbi:GGDEF domain-containing protein [Pseudoalteromonas sp. OOF1S-7]|uniref:GGDEF domain-containing protein n=1 Tax=Pseudoalteromonas sp. OOF1S-7 TaxID=2917757 RepID=UPI001EF55A13|nr:GGDEF domain-containing protein [Pseudoalteromonas sp. OOF1S-7]MCG7537039.1 GGDEF domain-containing protein [Pseudoalteromonas sp. OOF1S-7]
MEFDTTLTRSAHYLKQALPIMIRYRIPLTPLNYSICYCYVVGSQPELNVELDQILARYQSCPPHLARELFDKYLSQQDLALFHEISHSFQGTIDQVQSGICETLESSQDFSAFLSECHYGLHNLKKRGSEQDPRTYDEVLEYVSRLTREAVAMQQNALGFQNKLEVAYDEIKLLKEALFASQREANTDKLTGLLNRGKFDEDIVSFCAHPLSKQKVLVFVDIDHFKRFNDDFGHQKGDDILRKVAEKLAHHAQGRGDAYRYGGEEFCLTLSLSSVSEAVSFANMVRQDIRKLSVKDKKTGTPIRQITASFGIALHKAGAPWQSLVELADRALYLAKSHGRDRVEVAG